MNDQYTRRLLFDLEPRELVRLLRGHKKAKAGPFSWKVRHEGRAVDLFLVIEKSDKDGFEGTVSTMLHRISGSNFFAKEGEPVATLHGTRVRDGETLVLMKCPDPKVTGWIFVNFVLGMEELQQELARSAVGEETRPTIRRILPRVQSGRTFAAPAPTQRVKSEEQPLAAVAPQARDKAPGPNEPTPEAKTELEKGEAPASPAEAKPWLHIPDVGWDRMAVRLLQQGYSSAEIARKIEKGIVPKTVENRLSALRAQYGPEIVPYRKKPARNRDRLG